MYKNVLVASIRKAVLTDSAGFSVTVDAFNHLADDSVVTDEIFPELKGRLNGHAVRVPLANASLTDCVFEVERTTTAAEVNALLKAAADGPLKGILGYEERPLVSIDYRTDPRSSIIDALSTMVINGTQVKLYAWYDNEWGYANRAVELARLVGLAA